MIFRLTGKAWKGASTMEISKMTYEELVEHLTASGYKAHHTAKASGYVSREADAPAVFDIYEGRFGKGFKVYSPRYDTNRYCNVFCTLTLTLAPEFSGGESEGRSPKYKKK